MSTLNKHNQRESATNITYQGFSHAFKLQVLAEVENGLISINQAAIKYKISRAAIQKWMKKYGNLDKKLRDMGGKSAKQEIQELRKQIKELETQKIILETAIEIVEEEYGVDVKKKFLPPALKDTYRKLNKK